MKTKLNVIAIGLVAAILSTSAIAHASLADSSQTPVVSVDPTPPTYVLGPDDQIGIDVVNFPDLTLAQMIIPPDGKIRLPLIGAVMATGETPDQLAKILTKMWSEYVIDPSVTVALVQKRTQTILVYGFVNHPSAVMYRDGITILQALAVCGGEAQAGDLTQVGISHSDGTKQVVDLSDPASKAGTDQDLILHPDDLVYIPQRHMQISVLGQVLRGGSFDYTDKMTALDAITEAGGPDPVKADLNNATLVHDGVESKLDLQGLLKQGNLSANVSLSPGDRIFIPLLQDRTYVYGAVSKPGYYDFTPGDRILDALNDVGGPTPTADLGKVNVIHIDKAQNTATVKTVNIKQILTGQSVGDLSSNLALAPGDILYIPDKRKPMALSDVFGALGSFSVIGSTVRLLGL